uniref:ATP-dependent clp protease ATP-binding subunit n=1 Tax=Nitzschia sp. PL3-2 TaxID=2083271 RepID=A0A2Z5ZAI6_9STRA|nr:ATP-dependent clp protease ATP-binding subunit [Nitzschia sp. PL3-2]BBC77451.1 ATP-dependent clp protease ATP-binding subunit [Nitzschia sp. PL3-2]
MLRSFTEDGVWSILRAQREAIRLKSLYVGTEHILLGIFYQSPGIGSILLLQFNLPTLYIKKIIKEFNNLELNLQPYTRLPFDKDTKKILYNVFRKKIELNQEYIGTEHILFEILKMENSNAYLMLKKLNINPIVLERYISNISQDLHNKTIFERNRFFFESKEKSLYSLRRKIENSYIIKKEPFEPELMKTELLYHHSANLTSDTDYKHKFKIFGRDQEINRIVDILAQLKSNTPILLGEPGIGRKTTIEALVQCIQNRAVPSFLQNVTIKILDIFTLMSTARFRGEFELKLYVLITEISKCTDLLVVIKEIHKLLDARTNELAINLGNFFKSMLSATPFKFIGISTEPEYNRTIGDNFDLARYFQTVFIREFDANTAFQAILRTRDQFEKHHSVIFKKSSIREAVFLSDKYIKNKFLPEKAIKILDEAGTQTRLKSREGSDVLEKAKESLNKIVSLKDIAINVNNFVSAQKCYLYELKFKNKIKKLLSTMEFSKQKVYPKVNSKIIFDLVSSKSHIPIVQEKKGLFLKRLLNMEKILHKQIVGQKNAVGAVAKAMRRAQSGFRNVNKPIASFIFAGPTGVGKTELTKSLTRYLFDTEESLIRFDMSEYMEKYAVARLIGSPPGYVGHEEGGQLTEAVSKKPYSVVLFDEVEKGHPDIYNLLLQLLDDGRLTDSKGIVVNFSNTVIILTTNLGANVLEENRSSQKIKLKNFPEKGWCPESDLDQKSFLSSHKLVLNEIRKYFKPEFINRLDDIIIFHHLTLENTWKICRILINKIQKDLMKRNVALNVDLAAQSLLTKKGYNPAYGARPLRRIVTKELEDVLSRKFLIGELIEGCKVNITRVIARKLDYLKIYLSNFLPFHSNLLSEYSTAMRSNYIVLPIEFDMKPKTSKTKFAIN